MYCSREYQPSTRFIQQYEKSTSNIHLFSFVVCNPVLVHQSIMRIAHLQSGHGYVDICGNVVQLQMKLVSAWWKESFLQCVSASSSDR